jgi:arylformamidase
MSHVDLEREYNNRLRVPDHPAIGARWQAASAVYRKVARAELDIAYGPHERHRYDLFHAGDGAPEALAVYIHGGYWQRGDRTDFSFVARELNRQGVSVALPSYRLCPEVKVADIVEDIRAVLVALWQRAGLRAVVVGHSAGGHLAAAMLATDWQGRGSAPADLVRAGYALSGVFEVAPLIHTSINEPLQLDLATAQAVSPILWPAPATGRRFVAAVGGAESAEFQRQSLEIAATWAKAGVTAECVVVPGADHFSIVDEMSRPHGAMVHRIAELARWVGARSGDRKI